MTAGRIKELAEFAANRYFCENVSPRELVEQAIKTALVEAMTEEPSLPMIDAGYNTGSECRLCHTTRLECSAVYAAMCAEKAKQWK